MAHIDLESNHIKMMYFFKCHFHCENSLTNLVCLKDFQYDLSSTCNLADVDLQLGAGRSESFQNVIQNTKIFDNNSILENKLVQVSIRFNRITNTHFVVHPAKPFGRNLRAIVVCVNVWCILNPSISAIKVVIVLKVLITIFIRAN